MNFEFIMGRIRRKYLESAGKSAQRSPSLKNQLKVELLEAREVPATLPAPVIDYNTTQEINNAISGIKIPYGSHISVQGAIAPVIVANPIDSNVLFGAVEMIDGTSANSRIGIIYSGNGGKSWTGPEIIANGRDNNLSTPNGGYTQLAQVSSPSVTFDRFNNAFLTYVEHDATSSTGRVVLRKFNMRTITPLNNEIDIDNGSIQPGSDSSTSGREKVLYSWYGSQDAAFNPTVAIDNNLPTFQDWAPDAVSDLSLQSLAGRSQIDNFAATQPTADTTKVFVAWNTFGAISTDASNSGRSTEYIQSRIRMAASEDGGEHFGPQVVVHNQINNSPTNGGDYDSTIQNGEFTAPKIVFTPGRTGIVNSGGKMVTVYTDSTSGRIYSDSYNFDTDGNVNTIETPKTAEINNSFAQTFNDGQLSGGTHLRNVTVFNFPITAADLADITILDKISVTLGLRTDSLSELKIDLLAPDLTGTQPATLGAIGTYTINPNRLSQTLLFNSINEAGLGTGRGGASGTDLGRVKHNTFNAAGFDVGTTFEDNASRRINDGSSGNSYGGSYRLETGSLDTTFGGLTAAQMTGNWQIVITDFRNSATPVGTNNFPRYFTMANFKFSQDFNDALNTSNSPQSTTDRATGSVATRNNYSGGEIAAYPNANTANPNGTGAGLSVAVDNSLGAYSQFQNRIYAAYNTGGNINVIYSDDGGTRWTTAPSSVGAGFNPAITVDPQTGTVVVAGYSATQDPTGRRAVTFVSTSVNGAAVINDPTLTPQGTLEFSSQSPVNPIDTTYDQITGTSKVVEYVPSNGPAMTSQGFGNNMGLVSYAGKVKLVYAGNLDRAISQIRTQQLTIASGPRIVGGNSGPILGQAVIDDNSNPQNPTVITYNDPSASGQNFTKFYVEFDRPVLYNATYNSTASTDPQFLARFTPDDIDLRYRAAGLASTDPGVRLPVDQLTIQPLDEYRDSDINTLQPDPASRQLYGHKRFLISINPASGFGTLPGTYSYTIGNLKLDPTSTPGNPVPYRYGTTDGSGVQDRIRKQVPTEVVDSVNILTPLTGATGVPLTITDQVGTTVSTVTSSVLFAAPTLPPGVTSSVINDIEVTIDISHLRVDDLSLALLSPSGVTVPLVLSGDATGVDFTNTTFRDTLETLNQGIPLVPTTPPALNDITSFAPYNSGPGPNYPFAFKPASPLSAFNRGQISGIWTLIIQDRAQAVEGVLNNWTMRIRRVDIGALPVAPNSVVGATNNYFNAFGVPITDRPPTITATPPAPIPSNSIIVVPPPVKPVGVIESVVNTVTVTANITHANVAQLSLQLVSPSGQVVNLVNVGQASGANFTNTVFSDAGAAVVAPGGAPYTGTFKPVANLSIPLTPGQTSGFYGSRIDGIWTLRVTDNTNGVVGMLNNWSLSIQQLDTTESTPVLPGNNMDQDGDSNQNEDIQDTFSVPSPDFSKGAIPFQLPFVAESLPVVVPGPRITGTRVLGQPASTDNLVNNTTNNSIDIQFDRVMDSTTFTTADILRLIGPTGDLSLTDPNLKVEPITALNGAVTTGNSQFYRITFTNREVPGNYQIQLSSDIADANGYKMDKDTNAGVNVLTGLVLPGDTYIPQTYNKNITTAISLPARTTTSIPLDITGITDGYALRNLRVNLSMAVAFNTTMRDLDVKLVKLSPTTLQPIATALIFNNAPRTGNVSSFGDVTFNDASSAPVRNGFSGPGGTNNAIDSLNNTFNGLAANGRWLLVVSNTGTSVATLSKFALILDKPIQGTGLGDVIADQSTVGFRIHYSDELTSTGFKNWEQVGLDGNTSGTTSLGEATNYTTAGRVSNIAVDPSDPSGNTVYASGASGGVWRTSNFLTRDPRGPNWYPISDFGTNQVYRDAFGNITRYGSAINIGSLTVFNDTGDPLKTKIVVGTGSSALNLIDSEDRLNGNTARYDGVGFLISEDAGKTWNILDSRSNYGVPTAGGSAQYYPITDVKRDHLFVGAVINKVVIEKKLVPDANPLTIYAAVGRGSTPFADQVAGLWRTFDSGKTWTQIYRDPNGNDVTDFTIGEGSAQPSSFFRPTIGYVAVQGSGVLVSTNLTTAVGVAFNPMNGGLGRPTINQNNVSGSVPVAASQTPNGAKGRIVLASPTYQNNVLRDNYYQNWLVAAVATAGGGLDGIYLTKDAGANWTRLRLTQSGGFSDAGLDLSQMGLSSYFTNQNVPNSGTGANHSLTLALDPTDPNILYVGSDRIIRVDMTQANDPYKLQLYSHTDVSGNVYSGTTDSNVSGNAGGGLVSIDNRVTPGLPSNTPVNGAYDSSLRYGFNSTSDISKLGRRKWNFLNLKFDPYSVFDANTTLYTTNLQQFVNDGADTRWNEPSVARDPQLGAVNEAGADFDWVSNIVTMVDPLTGKARVLYGHDEGIGTFVSESNGSLNRVDGFEQPNQDLFQDTNLQQEGNRSGDIQVARFYSGDVQPSATAAGIANSMVLAAARRVGDVYASDSDVITNGNKTWNDLIREGRTNYVQADPTGSGTIYILRRINDIANPNGDPPTDFFQIQELGGVPISRTNGLFQNTTSDPQGFGQWTNAVKRFTVNPIDKLSIMMSSNVGRVFATVDQGKNWRVVAEPNELDGTYAGALAYGAPVIPNAGDPPATLSDYKYAGTDGGRIFVKSGNALAQTWKNITNGDLLSDGTPILKIVASPVRGSNSAYAVTDKGVYFMADWTSVNGALSSWKNISGNLFTLKTNAFKDQLSAGQNSTTYETTSLQKLTTIAVDWRPLTFYTPTTPILYAGGDSGVYRSLDNGLTWIRFTDGTTNATNNGGGLPNVKITDLDLSIGNVIQATGRTDITAPPPNLLIATTLGRGTWSIGLETPNDQPTLTDIPDLVINEDAGQQTVSLAGISPGVELNQNITVTATFTDRRLPTDAADPKFNPALFPNPITVNYQNPNSAGTLNFTPAANQNGVAYITVTVKDDGGTIGGGKDTKTFTFKVTVNPVNDPPTLNPIVIRPPITRITDSVLEDSGPTIIRLTGITDGDGGIQTLTVTATSSNPNVLDASIAYASPNNTASLVLTTKPDQFTATPITITVYVTDNGGTSFGGVPQISRTFQLVVDPKNDAPSFTPGGDFYVAQNSGTQTFPNWATNLSSGPPNEVAQTLTFQVTNSDNSLFTVGGQPTITSNGTLTFTPAPNKVGTATVFVTLKDNGGTADGGVDTSTTLTFSILIGVNRAPVLTPTGKPELLPVGERTNLLASSSAGTLVSTLLADTIITDQDATDPRGIAVVGMTQTTNGAWEYSTDNGGTWNDLSFASFTAARLLRPEDRVRFVPNIGFSGKPTLTYHAWDQSFGQPGGIANLTGNTGASSPFSLLSETATQRVVTVINTIGEDAPGKGVDLKRITDTITDTIGSKKGLAIIGSGGEIAGVWQYSINNGLTWLNFGNISLSTARLLRDIDKVRFVPAANVSGDVYLKYLAWDQNSGVFGGTKDLTAVGAIGGNTAFSATSNFFVQRVTPANDRPVLDVAALPILTPIAETDANPTGDLVSNILGATVSDRDIGSLPPGLAVTGFSTLKGTWQYKQPTTGWINFPTAPAVSLTNAFLLEPTDRIRFLPAGLPVVATISYKAWDRTEGASGIRPNMTTSTAYSTGVATAKLNVGTPVIVPGTNSAPTLNNVPVVTLPDVAEDTKPTGALVSTLLGGFADANGGSLRGIAITGLTGDTTGTWQYSKNGTTWLPVGLVDLANALLLKETDRLRYLPGLNFNGNATVEYHAWDQTRGTSGQLANLTIPGQTGGSSPFSTGSETATVTVTPVNDIPVLAIKSVKPLTSVAPGTVSPLGDKVSSFLANAVTDVDTGAIQGIAITSAPSTKGFWEFKRNGGNWNPIGVVSAANALFLDANDSIRFSPFSGSTGTAAISFKAWDQTQGAAGNFDSTLTTLAKTSLSTATGTATITFEPNVNHRPVLDITPNVELPSIAIGNTNSAGETATNLLGSAASDLDVGTTFGIAIVSVDLTNGDWQFFNSGANRWDSLFGVSATRAILLGPTDKVRFVPTGGFTGTSTFKYKAWDMTPGSGNVFAPANTNTTAFSTAIETATVAVNSAPIIP